MGCQSIACAHCGTSRPRCSTVTTSDGKRVCRPCLPKYEALKLKKW